MRQFGTLDEIFNSVKLHNIVNNGYFLVQGENNIYLLFDTKSEFIMHMKQLYNNAISPHYHEIIFRDQPRKFFLDIDYSPEILNEKVKSRFYRHLEYIKSLLVQSFNEFYNQQTISMFDLKLVSSNSSKKMSYNIIIDSCAFPNYNEFREFGRFVYKKYKDEVPENGIIDGAFFARNVLDPKSFISNRIVGCTKFNKRGKIGIVEDRFKVPENKSMEDIMNDLSIIDYYLIGNCDNRIMLDNIHLATDNAKKLSKQIDISDEKIINILEITKSHWKENFAVRKAYENKIEFFRLQSSYCKYCGRNHDKDNTLYMTFDEYDIYIHCYRTSKSYDIIRIKDRNYEKSAKSKFEKKPKINIAYEYLHSDNIVISSEPTISYKINNSAKITLLKAEMKMGKSKLVREFIKSNNFEKVIFISFRRTFTNDLLGKFEDCGFISYNSIKGNIDLEVYPKLIIQIESLSRICVKNYKIDAVILDEVESIWSQFGSSNYTNYNLSIAIFEELLKVSDRIICMDANLSRRTYEILKYIYGESILMDSCNLYENNYNPNYNIKYVLCKIEQFYHCIENNAKQKKNIAIFTNSLAEANRIYEYSLKYYHQDDIVMYTSKTRESFKRKHFMNVNKYWKNYKLMICTPTVSAGVSFEIAHFDIVMGYFSNMSCNVETCRQMLGRIRNVRDGKIYLHLNQVVCKHETKIDNIKRNLITYNDEMVKKYNLGYVQQEVNMKSGTHNYTENLVFKVAIHNISIDNKSRVYFIKNFIAQIEGKNLHAQCEIIDYDQKINDVAINKIIKDLKDQIVVRENSLIVTAKDITKDEYLELKKMQKDLLDITEEEIHSIKKYKIQSCIGFDDISVEIAEKYSKQKYRNQYNNCKEIYKAGLWDNIISGLMDRDANYHMKRNYNEYLVDNSVNSYIANMSNICKIYTGVLHKKCKYIYDTLTNCKNRNMLLLFCDCGIEISALRFNDSNLQEYYLELICLYQMLELSYFGYDKDEKDNFIHMYYGVKLLSHVYGFTVKSNKESEIIKIKPPADIEFIDLNGKIVCKRSKSMKNVKIPQIHME